MNIQLCKTNSASTLNAVQKQCIRHPPCQTVNSKGFQRRLCKVSPKIFVPVSFPDTGYQSSKAKQTMTFLEMSGTVFVVISLKASISVSR